MAEASLTVIARAAGGSFRDAIGILDQLATYSGGAITLQETLDILGVVQHDLLFEVVDLVHERDTQGALLFVERLSQGGTDYTQFIKDLLGHLRDLYVVKHTGEAPASIAITEEQLAELRSQAARVSTAETVAFIDLLGEALRSVRQGSDPRLELELVLIKMTALAADGPRAGASGSRGCACCRDPRRRPLRRPRRRPVRGPRPHARCVGAGTGRPDRQRACPEPAPTPPPAAGAPAPAAAAPARPAEPPGRGPAAATPPAQRRARQPQAAACRPTSTT